MAKIVKLTCESCYFIRECVGVFVHDVLGRLLCVVVYLGPATVRMVSNSGPPVPMPMQVPPGHMVQQIVDENGILTHVILSPQPPGIPAPGMMVRHCLHFH